MTNEKIENLLMQSCERCTQYSSEDKCDEQKRCPVYQLYKIAKRKPKVSSKFTGDWLSQGNNDFDRGLPPEMI